MTAATLQQGPGPLSLAFGMLALSVAALPALRALSHPAKSAKPAELPPPRAAADLAAAASLRRCAALLAGAVLLDSAVEHYRGGFTHPGMFAPLLAAGTTLAAAVAPAPSAPAASASLRIVLPIYRSALGLGLAGTGFHLANLRRRPGGFSWHNLFYGAPLGAPSALALAGAVGLLAHRRIGGRALCALAAIGMAGSSAEATLLHFRGAYHHAAMWLPVSVPPIAAVLLARAALAPASGATRTPALVARGAAPSNRLLRAWLTLTGLLGAAGLTLHSRGVGRQMGGWRNWSQNLQAGPPLPAPLSFPALAMAGHAGLALLEQEAG